MAEPIKVTVAIYKDRLGKPGRGKTAAQVEDEAHRVAEFLTRSGGTPWQIERVVLVDGNPEDPRNGEFDYDGLIRRTNMEDGGVLWAWGDGALGGSESTHFKSTARGPGHGIANNGHYVSNVPQDLQNDLIINVFNTEREDSFDNALESIGHSIENMARAYDPQGFHDYTGRDDDPYGNFSPFQGLDFNYPASDWGYGVLHLPPGASRHYQYDAPGSERWGGTRAGFQRWWYGNLPDGWVETAAGREIPVAPRSGNVYLDMRVAPEAQVSRGPEVRREPSVLTPTPDQAPMSVIPLPVATPAPQPTEVPVGPGNAAGVSAGTYPLEMSNAFDPQGMPMGTGGGARGLVEPFLRAGRGLLSLLGFGRGGGEDAVDPMRQLGGDVFMDPGYAGPRGTSVPLAGAAQPPVLQGFNPEAGPVANSITVPGNRNAGFINPAPAWQATTRGLIWPIVGQSRQQAQINTPFGGPQTVTPGYEGVVRNPYNTGVDLGAQDDTSLVAPFRSAKVKEVTTIRGQHFGYGNSIVLVDTETGIEVRFAHLKYEPGLKVGQVVGGGSYVGSVGMTGNATGPHLDAEAYVPGVGHVDFLKLFDADGGTAASPAGAVPQSQGGPQLDPGAQALPLEEDTRVADLAARTETLRLQQQKLTELEDLLDRTRGRRAPERARPGTAEHLSNIFRAAAQVAHPNEVSDTQRLSELLYGIALTYQGSTKRRMGVALDDAMDGVVAMDGDTLRVNTGKLSQAKRPGHILYQGLLPLLTQQPQGAAEMWDALRTVRDFDWGTSHVAAA